ncbi:Hpt domain-containing protein [Corallincola luteus]|uniref:Hpt domain-containing protein n=1 Tax=Corallincola luteus TaxID=1775177 RepID=A0ABY2APE6_9GAMM|nr:Hpt domain-containing protein [Corallincola luteus]TCI03969.1 Hpt domain-containing protein [Corallincola luteus]
MNTSCLSEETLEKLLADTGIALWPQLRTCFIDEAQSRVEALSNCSNDRQLLLRESHTLCTSGATFGAIVLSECAGRIEGLALAGSPEEINELIAQLERLWQQTQSELLAYQPKEP